MAVAKKKRLFKVASEINIGKDAIVDYLVHKGFDIENKPTASLTPDMVELVYDKFKKEMRAAEKQREKIQKIKSIRQSDSKQDDDTPKATEASAPVAEESAPEAEVTIEDAPAPEVVDEKTEQEVVTEETAKTEASGPAVGEVIDLSKTGPAKRPKAKPVEKVVQADPEPIAEAPVAIVEETPVEAVAVEEVKEAVVEKAPVVVAPEPIVEETPAPESVKETVVEEKVPEAKVEAPKEAKAEAPKEEVKEDPDKSKTGKKKRMSNTVAEVEIAEGAAPKLKGLTIVGRIELKKPDPQRKSKKDKKGKGKRTQEEVKKDEAAAAAKGKPTQGKVVAGKGKFKGKVEDTNASKRPDRNKRKRKQNVRDLITAEDVDSAIKKTLAGMDDHSTVSKRQHVRHKRKAEKEEKEQMKADEHQLDKEILKLTEFVTTSDLGALMNVPANEIIIKCMELGLMVSINQRLNKDTITLIADDYNYEAEFIDEKEMQGYDIEDEEDDEADLKPRSPIVTVMGHVDHGKTSLLDFIRHSKVVAGEAGGITQHIGAYRVELPNKKHITFLDTPGHEAFTAMRARGASITDIVVLVVAADDSVMPQTIEAISHAQAARVPIVVAINKMDKPDANPDRIKQQLSEHGILVEDWGGKFQAIEISAKSGLNVETLLDKILLEAEMLELKANPDRKAFAAVVEANMDKGLGSVCTVIVQKGTLKVGDSYVAGITNGRVRAMFDERGNKVDVAKPSIPVRVIGFNSLPEAGDILNVVDSETNARNIANERAQRKREQEFRQVHHATLDDISREIQLGGVKDLFLVIKADVAGSAEALADSLLKQSTEEVRVNILHKGVGAITENDVMLAMASNAVVIGFQVSPTAKARKVAENEKVDIRLYNIIYDAINEIRLALEGLLTPDSKEDIVASIEVRKVFKISKLGAIAGCFIRKGKIHRNDRVRVLREGQLVYNGTIHSLKRNKDDVKEVNEGFECGIMMDNFNAFEENDVIEAFKITEVKRTLS
jgi:translation initiation factor IF-2